MGDMLDIGRRSDFVCNWDILILGHSKVTGGYYVVT